VIVDSVTGVFVHLLMCAVVDAHKRGAITPGGTPELWADVEAVLAWCEAPGDATAEEVN
jgi:hypothetical protein